MTTLKLFILAIIFVATSGALFTELFKEHKFLSFLASVMAIIASFYLIQDIYLDIKNDVIAELKKEPIKSEPIQNELPIQKEPTPAEPIKKTFSVGEVFRDRLKDGGLGSQMVVIPAGRFRMGDIQGGGYDNEKPVHWVNIDYQFAMGKYEVTFAEYDHFVEATSREKPNDKGWGRANRPVINVSWNDAVAYVEWLTQQTDKQYRLPSEAEWEYAARAGTETKYWWGNEIGQNRANCDGCGSQWDNEQTAPVGSFKSNGFGLFDMLGNVWEWNADPWHENYKNAPNDGRVWDYEKKDNKNRVLRGGSWGSNPLNCRAANRYWSDLDHRNLGFRVARTF